MRAKTPTLDCPLVEGVNCGQPSDSLTCHSVELAAGSSAAVVGIQSTCHGLENAFRWNQGFRAVSRWRVVLVLSPWAQNGG